MPKQVVLPIDTELQDMIMDFMLKPKEAIKCAVAWAESGLVWDEVRALPPATKRRLAATIVVVWAGMETGRYFFTNREEVLRFDVKMMLERIIIGMFVHSDRELEPLPSFMADKFDLKGEDTNARRDEADDEKGGDRGT
jgi:hypothetical protein